MSVFWSRLASSCKLSLPGRHSYHFGFNGCSKTRLLLLRQWCFILVALLHIVSAVPSIEVTTDANENTKQGDTVELSCIITGLTSSDTVNYVRWKRKMGTETLTDFESVIIANNTNKFAVAEVRQSTFRAYTLTISGIQRNDSGLYSCHLGYSLGNNLPTEISRSQDISVVYYLPSDLPSCATQEDIATLTIGASVTVKCSSQLGNPIVNITWTEDSPSGQAEVMSLKQLNEMDTTHLEYTFNITLDHQGTLLTCAITSELFPDFHRNCTIGPLVVDIPTTTTQLSPTTSPFVPTMESDLNTTTVATLTISNTTMSSSSALTVNVTDSFTTDLFNDSMSTLVSSNVTDVVTTSKVVTYPYSTPNPSVTFPLLAILGIVAGSLILCFLTCNVLMMVSIFSRYKKTSDTRRLRLRSLRNRDPESVMRDNMNRLRYNDRNHRIIEETEA